MQSPLLLQWIQKSVVLNASAAPPGSGALLWNQTPSFAMGGFMLVQSIFDYVMMRFMLFTEDETHRSTE